MLRNVLKRAAVLLAFAPACVSAETLARFNFLSDFSASDVNSDVVVSGFLSGTAITNVSLENDGQPANSWYGENWTTSSDPGVALNSDRYAGFQVTPQPGMVMTLSGLTFDVRPHGSGPRDFIVTVVDVTTRLELQLGAIVFHPDQSVFDPGRKAWATLAVASVAFPNLIGAHEIRIYGFDAQLANRELLIDNVVLDGTVSPVPEPTVLWSLALAGVFSCRRGRRRQAA